jgi:hypothetical protein
MTSTTAAARALSVILAALAPMIFPSWAAAQTTMTLEGVVQHEGTGVARAQISAVHSSTNERRNAVSDDRGFFRILDLVPGKYSVSARAVGYTPATQNVHLLLGQRTRLDFDMQRGPIILRPVAVQEQGAQAAEIQRMSVSTAVTEQEIQNLPLNSRNVMELAAVAPGIRSFRPASGALVPSAGALRDERFINLYMDGMEMKNLYDGNLVGWPQTGSPLPVDGLQEFRVLLNPYDAEYARAAAYVISAVTHRGTNKRHRSVFGYYQDKRLVSVTDFQRQIPNFQKPDFSRTQVGFNLRGPLVTDRLFYATSYELSDTDNFVSVIPGRPASDPTHWDSYAGVFKAPNRNHVGLLRLTYTPADGSVFDAIWSSRYLTGEYLFGGTVAHESAVAQRYSVNTVNLRHRWSPVPQFANELAFQFVDWTQRDRPLVTGPERRYRQTLTIGRSASVFEIDETYLRLVDRATWSLGSGPGSHLMKAGLEMARVRADQFFTVNRYGTFEFSDVNGDPDQATIAVGFTDPNSERDAANGLSGWVMGTYVNDEWRLTSRTVLNLGIRYDAEINTLNNRFTVPWGSNPTLSAKPELQGFLNRGDRKNDLNNVSPRFSVSWDVLGDSRVFLRSGWGIIYDRVPSFLAFDERRTATWRNYVFIDPETTDPQELRSRVIAGGGTPASIPLLSDRMEAPENRQWSLGVGVRIGQGLSLNADYIDQDVRKLFAEVNLNWLDRSRTPARRALSEDHGDIIGWGSFARARYHALLTHLAYNPNQTLRLNLAYTLGWAKAEWDVANASVPAATAAEFYVMQRTSGDERHRFVLSGTETLPFGLSVSTITTLASPRPYKTWDGQDLNRNNFFEDDWISGRRYRTPANTWRNWYRVVDLRLTWPIELGRRVRLSVTAEGFNIFNTENYSRYGFVQKSPTGDPAPDFGKPRGIFATRQLQLGTRMEF